MKDWLSKVPWFVGAPAVVVATVVAVGAVNYFTGPLFHETCHNERNLLTGEFEGSNCGEGAKVAKRQRDAANPPASTPAAAEATTGATQSAAPTPSSAPTTAPAGPGVLAAGDFRDGEPGHQGSGTAQVQRLTGGQFNLFLSNFSVTNGPDLVVVLSTDPGGSRSSVSSGLTLDKLKANNGNQNYAIPAGTDVTQFKSVIIYCKSFPTVFAYATLEITS